MKRRRRRPLLLLMVSSAIAASIPLYAYAGPGGSIQYPDLRADAPENVSGPEFYSTGGGIGLGRLLIRFDGFVTNIGAGPLEVSGNPQAGTVRQWARTSTGGVPSVQVGNPEVRFEYADGHNHFHLKRVMRYSLWNNAKSAEVAPGQKVGFCLYDIEPAPPPSPLQDPQVYTEAVTDFCDQGNPNSTSLRMGTSRGWRDVYDKSLSYQWVDVSDTAPGVYYVAADADPDNVINEGGGGAEAASRAFAPTPVTIPGWVAQPISVPNDGNAQTIAFRSVKFGNQSNANLRYRITDPPDHGTLSIATGATVEDTSVVYTPTPGYSGTDAFGYAAVYHNYGYPLNPPSATVTLTGTSPTLTISGAPASMTTGTSVQLTAALANLSGGVSWSATAGSVSPSGVFTAPPDVPAAGSVTVTAASQANPAVSSAVTIGIVATKETPRPGVIGTLTAGDKLLSRLAVRRINRRVFVAAVALGAQPGSMKITTTFRGKVLARCTARVPARRTVTCKVRLRRDYPLRKVRVTAKFTGGGKSAVRRAAVLS